MRKKLSVLVCLFAIITACATAPPSETISTVNPVELTSQLEKDLATAKSNQVDVLAPGLYQDAQSSLIKAVKALEKGAQLSKINDYIAEGNATLEKANEIAQVSRTILGKTSEAREKALKVDADKLGEPYMNVEKQYLKLTKAIENDNLSYAQKKAPEVEAAFRGVEIMAIQDSALGDARQVMEKVEKAKTEKIAPNAYADAKQTMGDVDAYIEQNPYAAEEIEKKAANAEFMAQRAMNINESSKKFKEMSPEASALYVETLFGSLGKALETGDIRNQSVEAQLNTLTGSADTAALKKRSLEEEIQNNEAKIEDLEQQLKGLQGYASQQEVAKQRLAAEREFNERFNEVQRYFRSNEAEVYKQKGRLVIRLRGIQFPVGKATLSPDNYNLLSKVQRSIQMFDQPKVTIEGHTDSTGSAELNKKLSQERAEAVRTYLIANKTLPENQIRAVGYGPDRPLAPNTTEKGRAVNRRIDVLISPLQAQ